MSMEKARNVMKIVTGIKAVKSMANKSCAFTCLSLSRSILYTKYATYSERMVDECM